MGGASVLLALGARADPAVLGVRCMSQPADSQCHPTISDGDFGTVERAAVLASSPGVIASVAGQESDRRDPRIKAALLMAPAVGLPFSQRSVVALDTPLQVLIGDRDAVVEPASVRAFAADIPGARVVTLPGVGHNDFLGLCAPAARTRYAPLCAADEGRARTHEAAVAVAADFFGRALR
jgi:predicted dienelactone hydrolase